MRVRKRNLVYLVGIAEALANEKLLEGRPYLGQYGTIRKIILSAQAPNPKQTQSSFTAYVTYEQDLDAAFAVIGLDGFEYQDKILRASFGMTKYCSFFLRNLQCRTTDCLFMHKLARKEDEFTKDEANRMRFTTTANLEELARSIDANYADKWRARAKEKLGFTPILGSVRFVCEYISKFAQPPGAPSVESTKSKPVKSKQPRKAVFPSASNRINRWEDSETEQSANDKSVPSSKMGEFMASSCSTSAGEPCLPTESASLPRAKDTVTSSSKQPIRSTQRSRSPTLRQKSTQVCRKVSKSNEGKFESEVAAAKQPKDFSAAFVAKHKHIFDEARPLIEDPLRHSLADALAESPLDKLLLARGVRDFYALRNRKTSAFAFMQREEQFEEPWQVKTNEATQLLGQFLALPEAAFAPPPEPSFSLFSQTYDLRRFE